MALQPNYDHDRQDGRPLVLAFFAIAAAFALGVAVAYLVVPMETPVAWSSMFGLFKW